MFNKLKQALEDFVAEKVTELIESADPSTTTPIPPPSSSATSTSSTQSASSPAVKAPVTIDKDLPSVDDFPFERVSKAPAVYEPITSFTPDEIPKMIEALDDPDPEQQVHAIQMAHLLMKQIPSRVFSISETLVGVMQTDPDAPARAAAAEALNVVKLPKGAPKDNSDRAIRQRYEEVRDALIQTMEEDDDLLTRQNAAESLALTGTESNVQRAFSNLWRKNDGNIDPFIKVATSMHIGGNYMKSLKGDDRKQFEDALIQAYVDYPEMEGFIRTTIQRAQLGRAIPYLVKTYLENDDHYMRAGIATSIGHLGAPESLAPLLVFLKDDDDYVSGHAIKALGFLKDSGATKPLKAFKATLPPRDSRHREIDKTLVLCGVDADVDASIAQLQSDDFGDQNAAIFALSKAGGDQAINALTDFLKTTENTNMAWEAYKALLDHPSEDVARVMIERVVDGTLGYRQVSYNFVSKMKMSHAINWLDKAVNERASPTVMAAVKKDREILNKF